MSLPRHVTNIMPGITLKTPRYKTFNTYPLGENLMSLPRHVTNLLYPLGIDFRFHKLKRRGMLHSSWLYPEGVFCVGVILLWGLATKTVSGVVCCLSVRGTIVECMAEAADENVSAPEQPVLAHETSVLSLLTEELDLSGTLASPLAPFVAYNCNNNT